MLPATVRLSRAQCTTLLSDPSLKVVFTVLGTLKYSKKAENKGFSVITGSKNQKKAVLRNKLRRRVYTAIAEYYRNSDKKPLLGMIYVSKQSYTYSFDEIREKLHELLEKAQKNS